MTSKMISIQDPLKHFGIAKDLSEEFLDEFELAVNKGKKNDALKSSSKFSDIWGD